MSGRARSSVPDVLNVLYVEDYAPGAALVLGSFKWHAPDIHLEVVSTAAEAIERLERFEMDRGDLTRDQKGQALRYDVVLTDLDLPDGSGLDILAHVRRRNLMLAVVILTASVEEDTMTGVLQAGADGYIAKRNDYLVQLPSALRAAAGRRRTGR